MADLTITLQEQITLPNNNVETTLNTKIIEGVNQTVRRVDTISTTFSGSGVEILKFVDSESQQTTGSFVKSDVKYIRITNLDPTNSATIYLIQSNTESVLFDLEAGKTLMFGNADFNASGAGDYVVDGYVDETYYSSFTNFDTIKAKAHTADIQLEYFVASS